MQKKLLLKTRYPYPGTPVLIARIMRIAMFLTLACVTSLYANGYTQETKLTFSLSNVKLSHVFNIIQKKTNYQFLYNNEDVSKTPPVTIAVKDATVPEILAACFENFPLGYRIINKTVVVLPVKRNAAQSPGAETTRVARHIVAGRVTDQESNPIGGVSVTLKGSQIGTVTDIAGNYSLTLENGSGTLIFSNIGYTSQELPINDRSNIDVVLETSISALDQLVVVGYSTQKRANVTGAISTVDMTARENAPLTNATQALQGVEGVYVNQAGGQPGRDIATIRIRGVGTLNDNSALVLVDGIEYPLSDVNPNDIESISVLKDAASAAIYGSRAANGVILVTTKSGKKGKVRVSYNNYFGIQYVNYLPDVVKDPIQFMEMRNQAQINGGRLIVDYSDELIEEYRQGMKTDPYIYPNNDWFNIMFDPAPITNHNVQFSGGGENITFALSLDYLDQKGVMMGSNSKRYALGFNTLARVSERLKIGLNINGINRDINEPVAGVQNLMGSILKAQAFHPTYLEDGSYANTFIRTTGHNIFRHPIVLAKEGRNNTVAQQYMVKLFGEYSLPWNITYKLNLAINRSDDVNIRFVPDIFTHQNKTGELVRVPFNGDAMAVPFNNRGARHTNTRGLNTTLFNTLNWSHSVHDIHNLSALVGYSMESFSDGYFWAQNEGYLGNDLYEIGAGSSNPAVAGSSTKSRLNSYFGRVGYNYDERYLFEMNFRYDGSSRFARGKRWGLFPSFSAGWRLDRENFLAGVDWLSNLKLRASWGQLGNERISLFRYVDLMSLGQDYPFGTNVASGAAVTAYNDPNITWETTTISNLGVDAGLWGNRLNLVFDIFKKRTTDILREVNLPAQVGNLTGPIRNIGTVDNTGFELGLDFRNTAGDFTYKFGGSITKIKNKVVDLNGQVIYNDKTIITEGYPINSFHLIHAIGIFQTQDEVDKSPFQSNLTRPGYLKYQDTDDDKVITEDDRIIVGGVIPEYTYQFNINLGYRGLELTTFFQGVQNINTYASLIGAQPFWFGTSVQKEWITDAWTPENRNARLPILTTFESSVNDNFRNSDFWLRDASYLRLKNIQLSYTLPKKVLGKLVSNFKVFANGQNLLTISKMKDFDPEKNINGSTFYEYPTVKIYTAGINVTF